MAPPPPHPLYTLRGAGSSVDALHFCCCGPGAPLLFSGSGNGAVHVWDLTSRRSERLLEGHDGKSVIWLHTLDQGRRLFSQGRDRRLCVWDVSEGRGRVLDRLQTGSVGFCQAALLDTLLAHPTEETQEASVVETRSWRPVVKLKAESERGMLMCMKMWQGDSGPLLCAGYEDGSLLLWDVSHGRTLSVLKVHSEPVMCLDFDVSRLKGVSGSSEKFLCSWSVDAQQNLQMLGRVGLTNAGVCGVRVRADGRVLGVAGWDGAVRLFGWRRLSPLAVLQHHSQAVSTLAFSDHPQPHLTLLAAGSRDQRISVWSVFV